MIGKVPKPTSKLSDVLVVKFIELVEKSIAHFGFWIHIVKVNEFWSEQPFGQYPNIYICEKLLLPK